MKVEVMENKIVISYNDNTNEIIRKTISIPFYIDSFDNYHMMVTKEFLDEIVDTCNRLNK